jgi:hypothetical protein
MALAVVLSRVALEIRRRRRNLRRWLLTLVVRRLAIKIRRRCRNLRRCLSADVIRPLLGVVGPLVDRASNRLSIVVEHLVDQRRVVGERSVELPSPP